MNFDSGRKLLKNPIDSSDHERWESESMGFDSKKKFKKPSLNHDIFRSWNGKQIDLREEGMESGLFLSPERSPQRYRSNYQNLSPLSKSEAVANGHRELMEMVSQMPESCYELSLRDIVENPMVLGEEKIIKDKKDLNMRSDDRGFLRRESSGKSKKENRALINRSSIGGGGGGGGFYLKIGFPKSLSTTKRKDSNAKVSPRQISLFSESESVSSSISSRSSSGSGRNNNRIRGSGSGSGRSRHARCGCWSWIYPKYIDSCE